MWLFKIDAFRKGDFMEWPVHSFFINFISVTEGDPSAGADLQRAFHLKTQLRRTKFKGIKELEKVMTIGTNKLNQ